MDTKISPLRGKVSEREWQARVDLAACYRVVALFGWDDLVFTHISLRLPGPEHHFLINPYGLLFEETTASLKPAVAGSTRPAANLTRDGLSMGQCWTHW